MLSVDCKFLEKSFDALNDIYFESKLPVVMITIQTSPRSHGYITINKVWEGSTDKYHEINLSAETINRPIENVLATLLHEMVHLYCMENNISDTSKGGRYHNRIFKAEAEKRQLKISYDKYIGYSVTSPTPKFIKNLKTHGLFNTSIEHHRVCNISARGGISGKKSSTRKYTCPACGISVRATKTVNIGCLDCGIIMAIVEK